MNADEQKALLTRHEESLASALGSFAKMQEELAELRTIRGKSSVLDGPMTCALADWLERRAVQGIDECKGYIERQRAHLRLLRNALGE